VRGRGGGSAEVGEKDGKVGGELGRRAGEVDEEVVGGDELYTVSVLYQ
jgi:hypothetical protein